jgi:hypothetical protein
MNSRLQKFIYASLFVYAILTIGFSLGFYSAYTENLFGASIRLAIKTMKNIWDDVELIYGPQVEGVQYRAHDKVRQRYAFSHTFKDSQDRILITGGYNYFLEHCPQDGCAAVELDRSGQIVKAYPFRPAEIFESRSTEAAYETSPLFEFARNSKIIGATRFPNGDLLINFHGRNVFPYGMGMARINAEGQPRWFRWDYSHHWAKVVNEDLIVAPGFAFRGQPQINYKLDATRNRRIKTMQSCDSGVVYDDIIREINGEGEILRVFSVLDAILNSDYRAMLAHVSSPCDPLHLNYVELASPALAADVPNINTGDYIVSLRNISSFAVLDRESGALKRLYRGSFFQQHSVTQTTGSKVILFDNWGSHSDAGPSRIIEFDLATNAERIVFPNPETPRNFSELFTKLGGNITVSGDPKRALISYPGPGVVIEIDIESGELLWSYLNAQPNLWPGKKDRGYGQAMYVMQVHQATLN